MKNEVASLMNNEKLMKIFARGENQPKLFIIHYSLFISYILYTYTTLLRQFIKTTITLRLK